MSESGNPDIRRSGIPQPENTTPISPVLAIEGGCLSVGRGATTLHLEGGRLRGCREDVIKAAAASLPTSLRPGMRGNETKRAAPLFRDGLKGEREFRGRP